MTIVQWFQWIDCHHVLFSSWFYKMINVKKKQKHFFIIICACIQNKKMKEMLGNDKLKLVWLKLKKEKVVMID